MQLPTGAPAVVGRPGSNLGSGLAALGDEVAAGAPLDQTAGTITGAVYLFAASDLATARDAAQLGRWVGAGGRFGTSVELAAFDSTGPWLVAGAPADGRGRVDVIGGLHPPLSGDVATVAHTAAPADGSALFGAALARVRIGGDDGIVVGAPGQLPGPFADGGAPAGTGSVFVIRGATLLEVPVLRLDAAGYPAAASAVGSIAGGAYGGVVAVGRFDDSLAIQIAVAAPGEGAVFVLNGL
jgi:hypothetical protein